MNTKNKKYEKIQEHPNFYDYLKHLTTISTGSVVIIVTFAEKFAENKLWGWLFPASILSFLTALVSAIICMFFVLSEKVDSLYTFKEDTIDTIVAIIFLITLGTIILGVLFLVIFAIRNYIN